MSYDAEVRALDFLNNELRYLFSDRSLVGFRARVEGEKLQVFIVFDQSGQQINENRQRELSAEVERLDFSQVGLRLISVSVKIEPPVIAHSARPGDQAWGEGLQGTGTLGWVIDLEGQVIGISNWHVFCARGNQTSYNAACYAAGIKLGPLAYFDPMSDGINYWDFAYCNIESLSSVTDQLRACEDGTTFRYPIDVANPDDPLATYYKVGARAPTCRQGRYLYSGAVRVDYRPTIRHFGNQLMFTKMSDPGDLGAIIVDQQRNRVVGLNFAGDEEMTVANPLMAKGWKRTGTRLIGEVELPTFEGGPSSTSLISDNRFLSPLGSNRDFPSIGAAVPGRLQTAGTRIEYLGHLNALGSAGRPPSSIRVISVVGDWVEVELDYQSPPHHDVMKGWLYPPTGTFIKTEPHK